MRRSLRAGLGSLLAIGLGSAAAQGQGYTPDQYQRLQMQGQSPDSGWTQAKPAQSTGGIPGAALNPAIPSATFGSANTTPRTLPAVGSALGQSGGGIPAATPYAATIQPEAAAPIDTSRPIDLKTGRNLRPYGAALFESSISSAGLGGGNPNYIISPGDRIAVSLWGLRNFQEALTVDSLGNVFIPEIGPIRVQNVSAANLNSEMQRAVASVYRDSVGVYATVLGSNPVRVYVTGGVPRPGYYPGDRFDSLLFFLMRAGGIDSDRGSFRNIRVLRGGRELARIDLYDFLAGRISLPSQFQEGDSIVVEPRGPVIAVQGSVANGKIFEFFKDPVKGRDIAALAEPFASASHVAVHGIRRGRFETDYLSVTEMAEQYFSNGDELVFETDRVGSTLFVRVQGNSGGKSLLSVPKGSRLGPLLDQIEIDPATASVKDIYIRRKSVALQQKEAIRSAVEELQRSVLTATSATETEASIRLQEAELIEKFVARAMALEPEGRVVLNGNPAAMRDMLLEADDEIVIPQKSDVVMVVGEVRMPQSLLYGKGRSIGDYVEASGGFNERADQQNIIVLHQSGAVALGADTPIQPGDKVMILPAKDSKSFANFKDVIEVMYKIAMSTGLLLRVL